MIKLVILDADGVLFDSDESNIAYYNAVFERVSEPHLTPEEERTCVFLSGGQVFEGRACGDAVKLARMHEVGRTLDFAPFFALLRPHTDLRPFLLRLKDNYKLALATNRSATIPAVVEHLNLSDVFEIVVSTRDPVRPKPAPDMLELCLERASILPEHAVYVGDSDVDREAARAANVAFVGVGTRVKAPLLIPTLNDLPSALAQLANTPSVHPPWPSGKGTEG